MIMAMICVGILMMLPEGKSGNLIAIAITIVSLITPDSLPFIDEVVMIYMTVKRFKSEPVDTGTSHQKDIDNTGDSGEIVGWE